MSWKRASRSCRKKNCQNPDPRVPTQNPHRDRGPGLDHGPRGHDRAHLRAAGHGAPRAPTAPALDHTLPRRGRGPLPAHLPSRAARGRPAFWTDGASPGMEIYEL